MSKIDLDELDKMLDDIALHYSPAFAGELKKAIQELRLLRKVVEDVKAIRFEYIEKLMAGVRRAENEDPDTIEARKELGEEVTTGRWLDASLLCSVLKYEVMSLQAYNQHTEGKDASGGTGEQHE